MVKKITKVEIVRQYLNGYHGCFYLRELASLLNKPHQSIKPYVEELVKENVLVKVVRKNLIEYKLNFANKKIYDYLIIAEKEKLLNRLEEEPLLEILYEKLATFFSDNIFIVFGSASKKILKDSDMDLLVIGKQNITKVITEFQIVYNKEVHVVHVKSLKELNLTFIKEIYKSHLILNNADTVIRFFGGLYEQNKLV